ncbi:MAG TPA: hypothetical protein EYH46_03515 [Sulfurivirga caldicuralii]|nr:hypothetical protein [Sulfurivirga caldicuralii]
MKQKPPSNDKQPNITRCSHDGEKCDSLAWAFWKAQRQLVELNLRLAHVKKQLRHTPSQDKHNKDDQLR